MLPSCAMVLREPLDEPELQALIQGQAQVGQEVGLLQIPIVGKKLMSTRLARLRPLVAILVLPIAASLALEVPTNATPKSRKQSTASKKKSGQAARGKNTAQSRSKGRGSKSKKRMNASAGSGARYTRVRVRGKNGRWVWKKRPVMTASVHGVGVHNFLTDSWTTAQDPVERTPRQGMTEIDGAGNTMSATPGPS